MADVGNVVAMRIRNKKKKKEKKKNQRFGRADRADARRVASHGTPVHIQLERMGYELAELCEKKKGTGTDSSAPRGKTKGVAERAVGR